MSKITSIGSASGDGAMMRPEDTLQDAINSIGKEGALENGNKVLVLGLDDTQDNFNITFFQAGMSMSQCLAVCEAAKTLFLKEMLYIPSDE
jgi:hypothetical protein